VIYSPIVATKGELAVEDRSNVIANRYLTTKADRAVPWPALRAKLSILPGRAEFDRSKLRILRAAVIIPSAVRL
jgi:hypothetical protein